GLAIIIVFFSFKATNFFTADNFNNVIVQMAGITMLAYGVVFVLLLGEIDLSIGYLSGIAALSVAELQLPGSSHNFPYSLIAPVSGWLAILVAVLIVAAIGAAQGTIVAKVGVPSFVVTVAGLAGAAFGTVAICNHASVPKGLPLAGVLVVIFLVALTFLTKRTPFGRHVYAVGGSAEAARRAGINVPRIRILVFMISGLMCGVGGVILAARLNSVDLNVGGGTLLLDAISAAVIGGTSLFGGRGEVRTALIGALVITTVSNGLDTAGYKTGTIYIVTGIILLLAVTLDTIARRLQVRSGR